MFTTLALCFALQQSASISLPAGFYSLQDVADALAKQHIVVAVAPSCAQETYAIRAEGVDWDKLRAALGADERLSITDTKHGWQIERSVTVKRDESVARDRYSNYALNSTHSFFAGVARLCAEMESRSQEEREAAVEKARKDAGMEQPKADAAQQFNLYSAEHDMPFFELSLPAVLTGPGGGGFDRVVSTNLFDARYEFIPDGDVSKFPLIPKSLAGSDAQARWARSVKVLLKLVWDPIVMEMAYRVVITSDPVQFALNAPYPVDFVPKRFHLSIPVDAVWSKGGLEALSSRLKATGGVLNGDALKVAGVMPRRTVHVGEAILRASVAAKENVIYFVSPLTDYPLPITDAMSIADIVGIVNQGKVDGKELAQATSERMGSRPYAPKAPTFHSPATLTATISGGFCVIRNEMRFMDGFCDAPAILSSEFENDLLHDEMPKLGQLAAEVAKSPLPVGVSSDALDFCNPITFRPFAAALKASPALLTTVLGLEANTTESIPFSKLDSGARSALLTELQRCATVCDAVNGVECDPLILSAYIDGTGTQDLNLTITPTYNGFSFVLNHLKSALWRATIKNIKPDSHDETSRDLVSPPWR